MFPIVAFVVLVAPCVWFGIEQSKHNPALPPSRNYLRSRVTLVIYATVIATVNLALGHLLAAVFFGALAVSWAVWLYRRVSAPMTSASEARRSGEP